MILVSLEHPSGASFHLSKNKGKSISQIDYSRVTGNLKYLMRCFRLVIVYTISRVSNSSSDHYKTIVKILGYLRYTCNYNLYYTRYPMVFKVYNNKNWIPDIKYVKSTSRYVFTLAGATILWKFSKQTMTTQLTIESKFITVDK